MTFLVGVAKNKFAPSPCLFPPTLHFLAILHQIIVIFNYTKKNLTYPSQPMNLQHHKHSIRKCVCPNSGNNCPFHPNHFTTLLYLLLYPPSFHLLPLNTLWPTKTYTKTTLSLKLKVSCVWDIMSIPNLKTSNNIQPLRVPNYASS